jgi:hypothetical protein
MSENKLIKEFQSKDVNRIRNIISRRFDEKTQTSVGYSKSQVEYKEGDIWEEGDKQWTIKNGIKQNISKFERLKKDLLYPLICPKCSSPMKTKYDKECYGAFRTCFNCVINLESQLRIEGKYEDYIKDLQIKNTIAVAEEYKNALLSHINEDNSYVTEQGDIEEWKDPTNIEKLKENIDSFIQGLKDSIEKPNGSNQ